jgi:thymidine kinase
MSYLEIIMGPMFSGKTEMLINIYNTYSLISKPHNILLSTTFCIAFNYHKDTRYGENIIASHNKKSIPSINIEFLSQIFDHPDFLKTTHIFINEAQFFSDLKDSIIRLVEHHNKHVIICGLDSDFKRDKFGDMWDLIPHADQLTKLYGKCNNCNGKSLFTHRVSCEKQQEVIGNHNYIPLCRHCYVNVNNLLTNNVSLTIKPVSNNQVLLSIN